MSVNPISYETLSNREGFNAAVRHIKGSLAILEAFSAQTNLADLLQEKIEGKEIAQGQILPLVQLVLESKGNYLRKAKNLESARQSFEPIIEECKKWNAVDLVLLYFHPDLGVLAVNPKNSQHAGIIDHLRKYELAVVWAGSFMKPVDQKIAEKAIDALIALLEDKEVKTPKELLSGACAYKEPKKADEPKVAKGRKPSASAPKKAGRPAKASAKQAMAPAAQAPAAAAQASQAAVVRQGPMRMTPQYSVPVTNELFHNGNVEAWKRVIMSYTTKYPNLEVFVYYDGERITNLNSLFKWGKVKHGSCIQFAVAGDDIKDVAKLQRYLRQGASPAFEAFLKGPVTSTLNLF